MFWYKVASANEAYVITGRKSKQDQFRILTGKGAFVFPFFSKTKSLSLDARKATLQEPCVTNQAIELQVEAIAVFKVGDDDQSISNAARRFLDQQSTIEPTVGQVLAGHLRSIVGSMSVEEIIGDRNKLASEVKDSSTDEMSKMGLVIDSFQIREISDASGYIDNIRAPHLAAATRDARIAQAKADQDAAQQEQAAAAAKAGFQRDSQIAQAEAEGLSKSAQAKANQQGPLAEAQAQQAVAEQQAQLAVKNAEVTEANLQSQVRKPADAQKYAAIAQAEGEAEAATTRAEADKKVQVLSAEAQRDSTKAKAEAAAAQAQATKTIAEADANAIKVKNDALADGNLERQVATQLVEQMPAIVTGLAAGLKGSNLTILNGAEGIGETLVSLVSTGKAIFDGLRYEATSASTEPDENGDGRQQLDHRLSQIGTGDEKSR